MTRSDRYLVFALPIVIAWFIPLSSLADVKLAGLFGDHMVLQRDMPVRVWGWADPGEQVSVSIAGQSKSAAAGPDGSWMVTLDPLHAGAPLRSSCKARTR